MRSSDRWLRLARRVEVRLGAFVAAGMALLMAGTLATFSLLALHDALEEVSTRVRRELHGLRATAAEARGARLLTLAPMFEAEGVSLRILEPSGSVQAIGRPWPAEADSVRETLGFFTAERVRSDEFLVRSLTDERGATLEAAVPLKHFVIERGEAYDLLIATLVGGCILVGAFAVVLVRRSLAPLRAATGALERIDEHQLEARLPLSGADDLIDRHARAVNEVLGRLAWAFARVRTFSADVAHELRTPVNRILNIADAALLRGVSEAERATALAGVREAALAMARLIDSLLLLARGEEGRVLVHQEPVDLGSFVKELAELYGPACEARGIRLHVDLESVCVSADPDLLGRCLANLLDNAVRHTPDGKQIRLSVARATGGGVVRVEDSGPGVPLGEKERVFERFVQLDASRSSGGAGLGLAISRMIARLHRGELAVREGSFGGACFELTLAA